MSQIAFSGTITETGQAIAGVMDLPTARHNELPTFTDIQDDDILGGMDVSENKTKYMTIDQLRSKLIGEGIPQTPVLNNGIIELTVDPTHVDNLRWDLPSISGQEFTLERRGVGMLQTTEYNIISTGGFILTGTSPVMKLNETFILTLTKLQGGDTDIINNSGSFITGMVLVTTNTSWADAHKNKLINISGGTNKVTYNLPDISDVPENTLIPIETNINNTYQATIATTAGQLIYFAGSGYSQMWMGIGDNLWLYRGTDGWYVVTAYGNYLTVGEVIFGYNQPKNTIIAEGQLLRKDSYPRLWAYAQSVGASFITDAEWNELDTDGNPIRKGCFALAPTGDTDNFRVPDLRGAFARFSNRSDGLDQNGRTFDFPGGYQKDAVKAHIHGVENEEGNDNLGGGGWLASSNGTVGGYNNNHARTQSFGSAENTVKNYSFLPLIKC
ncbi:hypothetical protein SAMN05428988_0164 [Chitinophaga sp. YR573]|uniref:hypothetical protein n=1 Tax=Chitinophaga sp. YR573 TaxID=1881040 RepID=UPI0008B7E05D|nr:hypothetical protein [Chitinophaga sp. YR573]SEV88980.1 hypothetical protein SAMN05428988_0164 [Chitinophaga sp. YR573]